MKLVIAEKPSVAKEIAAVLGATGKKDSYLEGGGFLVSWCFGHLVENCMPEDYDAAWKNWALQTLPILPPMPLRTKVREDTQKQFWVLDRLLKDADVTEVVCATDAGREGEAIFRMVYRQARCTKPVKRLWISSMEDAAIRAGFAALRPASEYDALWAAAQARSAADWYVGINATRLYTCLTGATIHIGRVQTPTVNLVVQREQEIEGFVPTPYAVLTADTGEFQATLREDDYETGEALAEALRASGAQAVVTKAETVLKQAAAPKLFDLTELQRHANRHSGYTAQQTLDLAQSLYEKKLLSYPRTDSRYLTQDMEQTFCALYQAIMMQHYAAVPQAEIYETVKLVVNNKKVTDHHAILVTQAGITAATSGAVSLSVEEKKLLGFVMEQIAAAGSDPMKYAQSEVLLDVNGTVFSAKCKAVIEKGYTAIRPEKEEEGGVPLTDNVQEGQRYAVSIACAKKYTKAPQHYTEATLLTAMENAGRKLDGDLEGMDRTAALGTPATRAGVIDHIVKAGYVVREGKALLASAKARELMPLLPQQLIGAELTAGFEYQLEKIAAGELLPALFMEQMQTFVTELVEGNKGNDLASSSLARAATSKVRSTVGVCPRCGSPVYDGPRTLYCSAGKEKCGFVMFKEDRFFKERGKKLTKDLAVKLLAGKQPMVKGWISAKTKKPFDAKIVLEDTGKYVNYRFVFEK